MADTTTTTNGKHTNRIKGSTPAAPVEMEEQLGKWVGEYGMETVLAALREQCITTANEMRSRFRSEKGYINWRRFADKVAALATTAVSM